MGTVVDFHSHILPGIDDGSKSITQSIEMLRMETEQNIVRVVVTPHFYACHDNLDRFMEMRRQSEQCLRAAMENHNDLPEVIVGAEVHYFRGISESEEIYKLSIGQTNCILIEMPRSPWTNDMYQELLLLHEKRGLIPIIAHIERYLGRFRTYGIPQRLARLPVLIQSNADFFLNRRTSAKAMRLLKEGYIHLIGSDCHNLTARKPNLGDAVKAIETCLGADAINRINNYEQLILGGQKKVPHTYIDSKQRLGIALAGGGDC